MSMRTGPRISGMPILLTVLFALLASTAYAPQTADTGVRVRIETSLGAIDIVVDTRAAPVTSANFLKYVDGGFYTSGRFHRATRADNYTVVLPNRPLLE